MALFSTGFHLILVPLDVILAQAFNKHNLLKLGPMHYMELVVIFFFYVGTLV